MMMMIQSIYKISFSFSTWEFFMTSLFHGAYHDCLTTRVLLIRIFRILESLTRLNKLMNDVAHFAWFFEFNFWSSHKTTENRQSYISRTFNFYIKRDSKSVLPFSYSALWMLNRKSKISFCRMLFFHVWVFGGSLVIRIHDRALWRNKKKRRQSLKINLKVIKTLRSRQTNNLCK